VRWVLKLCASSAANTASVLRWCMRREMRSTACALAVGFNGKAKTNGK
jgi:hypothetical protein